MKKKIFIEGQNDYFEAYFGWQDGDLALLGLKEGYKNCADDLIDIALKKGSKGDIKTLDTYIFPILFCYRHSLEISLKQIYYCFYKQLPNGGHDLIKIYDIVKDEVINSLNNPDFINEVKKYKKSFIKYSIDDIDFNEIRNLLCELQGADNKADVWRYLMNKECDLYFTDSKFVDYLNIKVVIGDLYNIFDFLYHITSEYLSGDPE